MKRQNVEETPRKKHQKLCLQVPTQKDWQQFVSEYTNAKILLSPIPHSLLLPQQCLSQNHSWKALQQLFLKVAQRKSLDSILMKTNIQEQEQIQKQIIPSLDILNKGKKDGKKSYFDYFANSKHLVPKGCCNINL